MQKRIAVVAGDGIGAEVTREAVKVLRAVGQAAGHKMAFREFDWGAERYLRDGVALPEGALEQLRNEYDAILLGALGDPRLPDLHYAKEILFGLRFGLDLFANLRPVKLLAPPLTPLRDRGVGDIDFVIVRENTEGLYAGMGGNFKKGTRDEVAVQEDINTYKGVERILRYAFEYADGRRRRLVMADKSNALGFGHGLWLRLFQEMAPQFPGVDSRHMYIDNLALQLVRDPSQFDVIVTSNMFGDIISDLGAGLIGGLGLAPSANVNPAGLMLFEPVHGSAPDIAGQNIANPLAAVLAGALLLEHLGMGAEAARVEEAVRAALGQGKTTPDLGGTLKTTEVGDWLANHLTASPGLSRARR